MKRAKSLEKETLTIEEAAELYELSLFKLRALLRTNDLPYVLHFRSRKFIARNAFEQYYREHPQEKEEIRRAKWLSTKERLEASPFAQRRIHPC